jgi:molybdopterin synthase catalytic subunit
MSGFALSEHPIDVAGLRASLSRDEAGGVVVFEGVVRDHNEGRPVTGLAYQAYDALAVREGQRIVAEARERFAVSALACVHRVGTLAIGDVAVFVGASAAHRGAAFDAVRHVIDEVKKHVPIWKKERYADGESEWLHPQ